jgi:hypothetical protein
MYVDLYHSADLILILVIFILNCADAAFTLSALDRPGVEEANPLMLSLLARGPAAFLYEKVFLVGLCLISLLIHKNFRSARIGVYSLLVLYCALTIYHLGMVLAVA